MDLDPVELLTRLVAIPSVNPMGSEEIKHPFGEARLTDFLEQYFHDLGLPTVRQPIVPGRENLIARLDGEVVPEDGGPLLLFDAHQDTIAADQMTLESWTPVLRDGRMFGRGTCDTKGGMAAMIAAMARLADERPPDLPTVVLVCTVDEEHSMKGAATLASQWTNGSCLGIPRAPDAAIVAEPTNLDVVTAHKGVLRWRCHTRGRAGHNAQPHQGDNAIYKMARLLVLIEQYEREVIPQLPVHPLCGTTMLNVGIIRGGSSINIVPERAMIEIEMRIPPGSKPDTARQSLIAYLERELSLDSPPQHDLPYMQGPPLSDKNNSQLATQLASTVSEVIGNSRCCGASFAANAAFYAMAGTPSLVFGPGAIDQAHTANEWISLDQLHQAAEILYRFVKSWKRTE